MESDKWEVVSGKWRVASGRVASGEWERRGQDTPTAARPAGTPYPSGGSGLPPAGELLFVGVDGHCATIRRSTS